MSATLLAMVVNMTQSRGIVLVKIMSKTSRSLRRSSEHFFVAWLPGKNFSQNYVGVVVNTTRYQAIICCQNYVADAACHKQQQWQQQQQQQWQQQQQQQQQQQ